VSIKVGFGARDEERARLLQHVQAGKIDVATIHHVDGTGLGQQHVERMPRSSSKVCNFTAALVERKCAHGNTERHRSIVVESSA
jgi:hypothetical protein